MKKWTPIKLPDGTFAPQPGNERRAARRRAATAQLRGGCRFIPNRDVDQHGKPHTHAREIARGQKHHP